MVGRAQRKEMKCWSIGEDTGPRSLCQCGEGGICGVHLIESLQMVRKLPSSCSRKYRVVEVLTLLYYCCSKNDFFVFTRSAQSIIHT